jgi:mannose-6-phosphate isomerase-like protein (cupin superfamily)
MSSRAQWAVDREVPPDVWDSEEAGRICFRTLFGGCDVVPDGLTVGVGELAPGDELRRHSHPPAEVYYVLQGRCSVTVGEEQRELDPGAAVLIPGGAPHAVANVGSELVRIFYVLASEQLDDVEYYFAS